MKKKIVSVFLMLIGLGVSACSAGDNTQIQETTTVIQSNPTDAFKYASITPEAAKIRLDSGEKIILLDVRTQEEYLEKHIPNSLLIPVEVIEEEAPLKLTDKDSTIFVYCRSGRRSTIASKALAKMGYTKVYDLGGINDWTYETKSGNE